MKVRIGERDIDVADESVSVGVKGVFLALKTHPFKLQVWVNNMAKKCMSGNCDCGSGVCNIEFFMEHSRFEVAVL